jgi:hypothetical protein
MDTIPTTDPVRALQAALATLPDATNLAELTSHHFCPGLYARELIVPAGYVAVGKVHKEQNLFFLLQGTATLATPDGPVEITAPYMVITKPGEKRAVYAHTPCLFMNVHPNPDDTQDLEVLESRYITPEALPAPEPQELIA